VRAVDQIGVDIELCEDHVGSILWMQTPDGDWHVIEFNVHGVGAQSVFGVAERERLGGMTFAEWQAEAARTIEAAQRRRG
jgi:hypothetical protein